MKPCESCQIYNLFPVRNNKKLGRSQNHPNIISISCLAPKVKRNMDKITEIYEMTKWNLCILYNIPSCNPCKMWYHIPTKRWYQWSLKPKLPTITWKLTVASSPISSVYISNCINTKFVRKWFNFCHVKMHLIPQKERLTNDVRYQEFNEVTLDLPVWSTGRSRVTSCVGTRRQCVTENSYFRYP